MNNYGERQQKNKVDMANLSAKKKKKKNENQGNRKQEQDTRRVFLKVDCLHERQMRPVNYCREQTHHITSSHLSPLTVPSKGFTL